MTTPTGARPPTQPAARDRPGPACDALAGPLRQAPAAAAASTARPGPATAPDRPDLAAFLAAFLAADLAAFLAAARPRAPAPHPAPGG